jgi:hypothetical protein
MPLDGDIKLPGVGPVKKKTALIGGGVVGAILLIAYIRRARNASSTNASPAGGTAAAQAGDTGLVTDPAGNQCAAVNPDSGYCPGTEQDLAYSQQAGGYSSLDGGYDPGALASDYGIGGSTGYNPDTGLYTDPNGVTCETPLPSGYCPTGISGTGTNTTPVTTADEWIVQTAAMLPGSAATFTTAAAMVFAGLTVSTAQKDLFLEGVGINPLPNGVSYPQPIKTTDTSAHPGTTKVTVPNLKNKSGEEAKAIGEGLGFKVTQSPTTTPKGKSTTVTSQNPASGTKATHGSTIHVNLRTS